MPDPNTSESANGSAASGQTGQGSDLVQAIAAAVAAAVTTSMNEITNKLNAISQDVKAVTNNSDTNVSNSTVGSDDAFMGLRSERVAQSGMQVQMLRLVAASIDHFVECNKSSVATLTAIGAQAGRHADLAVARHWGTSPETANPAGAPPSK